MATRNDVKLTPEQKGTLASLANETGETASALMDKMLDELQERLRTTRVNRHEHEAPEAAQPPATPRKPIWAKIREAFDNVPEEELDKLPADGAANVDHYAYGLPKRS